MSDYGLDIEVHEGANNGPAVPSAIVRVEPSVYPVDGDGKARVDRINITVDAPGFRSYVNQPYYLTAANVPTPIALDRIAAPPFTHWPRRGISTYGLLTERWWDYERFLRETSRAGSTLTRFWLLGAEWWRVQPGRGPLDIVRPFHYKRHGQWDLYDWNPEYWDRLPAIVSVAQRYGVLCHVTGLELYAWSHRKAGPWQEDSPWHANVNGVVWKDDETTFVLPDAWYREFLRLVCQTLREFHNVVWQVGNEMPEKPMHFRIRDTLRQYWPALSMTVNRQEDKPGQYQNMGIGREFDRYEYHGWRDLNFLDVEFPGEPPERPRTFRQFFANRAQDGHSLEIEYARVIASSDGSRISNDRVETYDWPRLLEVFRFVTERGGSVDHQSRIKMSGVQDLTELAFMEQIARL